MRTLWIPIVFLIFLAILGPKLYRAYRDGQHQAQWEAQQKRAAIERQAEAQRAEETARQRKLQLYQQQEVELPQLITRWRSALESGAIETGMHLQKQLCTALEGEALGSQLAAQLRQRVGYTQQQVLLATVQAYRPYIAWLGQQALAGQREHFLTLMRLFKTHNFKNDPYSFEKLPPEIWNPLVTKYIEYPTFDDFNMSVWFQSLAPGIYRYKAAEALQNRDITLAQMLLATWDLLNGNIQARYDIEPELRAQLATMIAQARNPNPTPRQLGQA